MACASAPRARSEALWQPQGFHGISQAADVPCLALHGDCDDRVRLADAKLVQSKTHIPLPGHQLGALQKQRKRSVSMWVPCLGLYCHKRDTKIMNNSGVPFGDSSLLEGNAPE